MAIALRIMCHDHIPPKGKAKPSTSLLSQLGHKDGLTFCDTSARDQVSYSDGGTTTNVVHSLSHRGLVILASAPTHVVWVAPLDLLITEAVGVPFSIWWNDKVIVTSNPNQPTISRGKLIRDFANADGGAHVDPMIDVSHYMLTTDTLGATGGPVGSEPAEGNIAAASVRQITFEMLHTLDQIHDPTGA
jgi:hypothetical protein